MLSKVYLKIFFVEYVSIFPDTKIYFKSVVILRISALMLFMSFHITAQQDTAGAILPQRPFGLESD